MLKIHENAYIYNQPGGIQMSKEQNGNHWLESYVPYLFYSITGQHNRNLRKRLKHSGINIARWRVLSVLKDHGKMNISQIVESTIIEQPTVSRIVDQLEREGLAVRESGDKDLRFVQVMLSPAGKQVFDEIYPTALEHQAQALQGFSRQETKILIGFLERIQNNIGSDK
jgi:DNA-binding MarR family transcriptional regulator